MSTANDNADVSPLFLEFRPGIRKRIAAAVDALVALLDQIDGDADLEEDNPPEDDAPAEDVGDNEPSLGSAGSRDASTPQYLWAQGADDDREVEDELDEEGDDADDGEIDADCMDSWFNPPHLPGGNGAVRRTGR
jgi:hypothetical protein